MTTFERNIIDGRPFELSEAFEAIARIRREAVQIVRVDQYVNRQLAELRLEDLCEREKRVRREVQRRIG